MNQINIETEEFVKNLKVTFFDIASQNQTIMDEIESFLSKEHDPQKVEDLQNLWANYHETVKVFLNSVEVISDALYKLEACNQSFNEIVEEKETMMDKEQLQASDEAISEIVPEEDDEIEVEEEITEEKDETSQAEVEETSEVKEETPQEEVKEEVEETPEVKEETPQEEVKEEVEETPEVKEETPQEEVKEEVEETPEVKEENSQEEVKEEVKESTETKEEEPLEPVEATGDLEIVEEVNAADNPIPESISELSNVQEEATDVSKETIPLISSDTEVVPAENEEVTNDEVVEENSEESSPLILPVIEEENKQEKVTTDSLSDSSPVIADLPSLSTTSEEDDKKKDSLVFHKGMLVTDKAILINTTQAAKLRGSLPQQKLLFNKDSSYDEAVSENQLEEMMNQLATLYEQGKTKEAEQMSEKISVLNKKLTSAK